MSARAYVLTYAALMLLLGITLGAAYLPIGGLKAVLAFGIAAAKGTLIALYFMHLRHARGMTRAFAALGLCWLAILFALTLSDYVSRSWLPLPAKWPVFFELKPPQ